MATGEHRILSKVLQAGERLMHKDMELYHRAGAGIYKRSTSKPAYRTVMLTSASCWHEACIVGTAQLVRPKCNVPVSGKSPSTRVPHGSSLVKAHRGATFPRVSIIRRQTIS